MPKAAANSVIPDAGLSSDVTQNPHPAPPIPVRDRPQLGTGAAADAWANGRHIARHVPESRSLEI